MFKRYLAIMVILSVAAQSTFATESAQISLHISTPDASNRYYLCLYDTGCLSISAGNRGKTFQTTAYDMSNLLQFVITDLKTRQMDHQPNNASCQMTLKPNQRLTISGHLVIANHHAKIEQLRCHVS